MGRILAIDYGKKRTGVAVTDTLQIVPGGIGTIPTSELLSFLKEYISKEPVDKIVVGYPRKMDFSDSETMGWIKPFINKIQSLFPKIEIVLYDERFTTKLAQMAVLESGIKKEKRRTSKGLLDEISAVIILRDYLESRNYKNNTLKI